MLDIVTREFRIEDYDGAVQLWSRVEGVEIAEGDSRSDIRRYLDRNPGLSRVAVIGRALVGVALCGHDGRRGYIYHLAVHPDHHHKSIGRKLVAECVEGLRRLGLQRALILVADDNREGHAFWLRCGWEDVPGALLMGIDLEAN
jgi:N-acetylglutamate synthase